MPDVNILIYAHRSDEAVHRPYAQWLRDMVDGTQPFAISALVAVAFVRIVTNAKVYPTPTPLGAALATIEALVEHPRCRLFSPGPAHWSQVAQLCRSTQAKAKLVADAQHAAVAIAEGCTWVTRDGDFARFKRHGLKLQHLELS